jgi:spoIIIJ-associated protein
VGVPGEGFGTVTDSEDAAAVVADLALEDQNADGVPGPVADDADELDVNDLSDEDISAEEDDDVKDESADDEADDGDEADEQDVDEEVDEDEEEEIFSLEDEGEIAADYIEGLLDIADLDGDIDMDVEGDRAVVSVVGATLQELVGSDGEVLEALQELTRLAVHRQTGARARLMVDVGGFRERRRTELAEYGRGVADEVNGSGEPKKLRPMSPFERKIIHDVIAEAGLRSESEGEEPNRRVVVFPAD